MRFAEEPSPRVRVKRGQQKLDSDVTVEQRVFGSIDGAHPASANQFADFKVGDGAPGDSQRIDGRARIREIRLLEWSKSPADFCVGGQKGIERSAELRV